MGHDATAAALRAAARVFVINPADREGLEPLVALPHRLVELPAFLDLAEFGRLAGPRAAARRTIAARHGLDAGKPWLLTVAMMRPGDKLASYRILGQALAALLDLDWQLLLVGDGPARPEVEAALAPLGAGRVRYLGRLDEKEVAGCHAAADLCLWPAVNEAYGMALLEAQAAGLPVVAGAVGGVPSIVADGITGLLTPPGEAGAFAAAARRLDRRTRPGGPPWRWRPPRMCAGTTTSPPRPRSSTGLWSQACGEPPRGRLTVALLALLRHGPTSWTAARRLQGRADLPLSPEGRQAVARWRLAARGRRLRLADQPPVAGAGDRRSAAAMARPRWRRG